MSLCIFDLDGTLLNTLPTISHYGNSALAEVGFPEIALERYKYLIGDGRDVLIHRMLGEFDADTDDNFLKARKAYDTLYEADYMYLAKPYPNIKETLSELKKHGVKLAVLSNKPDNVAYAIVKDVFGDTFSEVWGKRSDYPTKPNPTAALEICGIMNETPENTVFIGDTSVDIKTGKNAGFYTIGVQWGFRDRKELEDAGADFVAESAKDIIEPIITKLKKDA